jgi:hypothetical protein
MVLATPNIYERIEPVAQLFLRRSASRTANQRRGFFPQGSGDASSPLPSMGNEIELAFEAFGSQHAFNMTLMPSIFSADASITVGVEGDEIRVVPPSQSSYMYASTTLVQHAVCFKFDQASPTVSFAQHML